MAAEVRLGTAIPSELKQLVAVMDGCELAFVAGGNTDPTGAVLLRRA